jgi:sulfur transfer protein SufE
MLEEQHIMGEQSICAHQERNCRLRQVVRNHLECYLTRRQENVAFKHFAYGDSKLAHGLAFCFAADVSVENAAQI